ncbi:MAG: MoxR family ATPase [Lentisphaeria bacterium]|nr:MoxR family ATPase [Lentisphaeria bacterium]
MELSAQEASEKCQALKAELGRAIIGQEKTVNELLVSLIAGGHCLLIGVPGLAKTLLVKSLADSMDVRFNRIQFTPDLMPADIVGSEIIREHNGQLQFEYQAGPIFCNLLLADEINRTPPKTQAALLEAMQEKRVTCAGETRQLPQPFFVVATQNPIEQEGTYPLPEAQLDRFMFSIHLDYPSIEEEQIVVKQTTTNDFYSLNQVLSVDEVLSIQSLVRDLPVADHVIQYAVELVTASRPNGPIPSEATKEFIQWGAGPRASQCLILGAKAMALLNGRLTPETEDVRLIAPAVLQHRVVCNYKATGQNVSATEAVQMLIQQVREPAYA